MKVLFLDFDGVLNTAPFMKALKEKKEDRASFGDGTQWWMDMIDPAAVAQLNRILDATGAKVVVSSTWRKRHSIEALQQLLEAKGFTGHVIDRTPDSIDVTGKFSMHCQRGDEIKHWLDQHSEVTEFAALDDDSDMDAVKDRHVKTHWAHWKHYPEGELGLGPEAADKAIALLNQG